MFIRFIRRGRALPLAVLLTGALAVAVAPDAEGKSSAPWWRGNLHTHTLRSDGDSFPEMVADWYRGHGYQFLAVSDHNVSQSGEHWAKFVNNPHPKALADYIGRFGTNGMVILSETEGDAE